MDDMQYETSPKRPIQILGKPGDDKTSIAPSDITDVPEPYMILTRIVCDNPKEDLRVSSHLRLAKDEEPLPVKWLAECSFSQVRCQELFLPYTVTKLEHSAFRESKIKKIHIPKNVTKIPTKIIADSEVEELIFDAPDNIVEIAPHAFSDAKHLKRLIWPANCPLKGHILGDLYCEELVIPSSITEFPPFALSGIKVKKVIISKGVKVLPHYLFANSDIDEIIFEGPKNIVKIEEKAFARIHYLKKLVWPSSCKIVPKNCFKMSSVEEIVGFDTVDTIEDHAFFNFKTTHPIEWPSLCNNIPKYCFYGATFPEIKNISHVREMDEYAFAGANSTSAFVWPENCYSIPAGCFLSSHINSFVGNDNLKVISLEAFAMSSLSKISDIDNVEQIEKGAFMSIPDLPSFTWPKKCKVIPEECFAKTKLGSFYGWDNVEMIGYYAFMNTGLSGEFSFSSLEKIGEGAFSSTCMDSVTITNNAKTVMLASDSFPCPVKFSGIDIIEVRKNDVSYIDQWKLEFDTEIQYI